LNFVIGLNNKDSIVAVDTVFAIFTGVKLQFNFLSVKMSILLQLAGKLNIFASWVRSLEFRLLFFLI